MRLFLLLTAIFGRRFLLVWLAVLALLVFSMLQMQR
jgi:hypothetical protein